MSSCECLFPLHPMLCCAFNSFNLRSLEAASGQTHSGGQRFCNVMRTMSECVLMQVSKMGSKSTNLQGALGVWGKNSTDMQERAGKLGPSPVRTGGFHSQGPGAIEACSSPGRSSSATDPDLGVFHTPTRVVDEHEMPA
jgi:hypothetical protein